MDCFHLSMEFESLLMVITSLSLEGAGISTASPSVGRG